MRRTWAATLLVASVISSTLITACNDTDADGATSVSQPDSMRLARKYAPLATDIAHLKREMWSRSTGAVLSEFRWTPPDHEKAFGALPELRELPLDRASGVQVELDASASATAKRNRTKLAYVDSRPMNPAFEQWVATAGFQRENDVGGQDTPNVIIFGDSVAIADVQAVALQLYATGTPVRSVRRFAAREGAPNTIQLRYLPLFDQVPPLSVEQIRALRMPRPDEDPIPTDTTTG